MKTGAAVNHLKVVNKCPMRQKRGYALPSSWENAIVGWLAWLKLGGARPETRKVRRGHVRRIARLSATSHPRLLTYQLLEEICAEQRWSNDHRKGVRTSLISFYDWAIVNGIAADNPGARLPSVAASPPNPRPAPDYVWHGLMETAGPRERMMARLAGELGMRRAEIAVCHRRDLHLDYDGWMMTIHGKGGKIRTVPVPDNLAAAVIEFCPEQRHLFPSLDRWGHQIAPHLSEDRVGRVLSALMPEGWSGHKLRHRFATRGLEGTKDLVAVQEMLGHVSLATTQRYVKSTRNRVRAVAEAAAPDRPA